jgi:hypothetical protein
MMRLTTGLLCDYAQVRQGLLHVVAGGVNRLVRPTFPAPMGVTLALVLELDPFERRTSHDITIRVVDADGRQVAQGTGRILGAEMAPDAPTRTQIPYVFDLRGVRIPSPGDYEVKVYVDQAHHVDIPFQGLQTPTPPEQAATDAASAGDDIDADAASGDDDTADEID